jgi:glycosyltransferase involved in cell wall biosynthesis
MLGWEFPPFFAGGVGMVCYELTKALSKREVGVTYVMPFGPEQVNGDYVKLVVASRLRKYKNINIKTISTTLQAYTNEAHYDERMNALQQAHVISDEAPDSTKALYGATLFEEIHKYALRVRAFAALEDFDLIHAHDWTTFPAAVAAKHVSGKPLIVHVHITQFDMVGGDGNINQMCYDIERYGMHNADTVICVSEYIKQRCMTQYGVPESKIRVLHNAATEMDNSIQPQNIRIKEKDKIVLFAGRVTLQKGPDYFVRAARLVLDKDPNVKFVLAGSGDMLGRMIELSANLGMADKFIFTGFYNRDQAEKLFAMADCFVMPSVSEPFGIVPLEAMQKNTPVIVSRQSGVSEVLRNALKVDFWDVTDMASKILAVLQYRELSDHLTEHGAYEVQAMTWDKYAERLEQVYGELIPLLYHHG